MRVSVIISFYNKPELLSMLLIGFERQSFTDFEIIIADDGSNDEVIHAVDKLIENSTLTIKHVWHKDEGWRKNKILNQAVLESNGQYLIFIDGDCIPHRDFVHDHYKLSKTGELLTGRRVRLSDRLSKSITPQKVNDGWLENNILTKILWDSWFGKTKQTEKGIRIFNSFFKNKVIRKNPKRQVLGCNFSMHKNELIALNGFDERYIGPGIGEDLDIDLRYQNSGNKVMLLKYCAVQYHHYHPTISRTFEANSKIYNIHQSEKTTYTPHGIKKGSKN